MQPLSPEELLTELKRDFRELDALEPGVFLVGGALRDLLLGTTPADIDLVCRDARRAASRFAAATSGTFVDLGRETFPTFRVVVARRVYDFNELSGPTIEEDLRRRDFTINAMAFDPHEGERVVDPFHGADDLGRGVVRMVAKDNIADDPLRILKGIRTAVVHGFSIDSDTADAFGEYSGDLARVARERVTAELWRMFAARDAARAVELLAQSGADAIVLPRRVSGSDAGRVRKSGGEDPVVVWAILFLESPGEVEAFARAWRWSEETRRDVSRLLTLRRMISPSLAEEGIFIALYDAGRATAGRLAPFLRAEDEADLARRIEYSIGANPKLFEIRAALSGGEISALTGVAPGKFLGEIKRALLEAQVTAKISTRAEAEEFVLRKSRERR